MLTQRIAQIGARTPLLGGAFAVDGAFTANKMEKAPSTGKAPSTEKDSLHGKRTAGVGGLRTG
jgi:hypothetical protein